MLTFWYTGNDVYNGDPYCGNDRDRGLWPPDDAILFTVSGITAIADKKWLILIKRVESEPLLYIDTNFFIDTPDPFFRYIRRYLYYYL